MFCLDEWLEIVRDVAVRLLRAGVDEELDDVDSESKLPIHYRDREQLVQEIIHRRSDRVLYTMGEYIGAIGESWEHDVRLVFHHMGLEVEQAKDVLFALIMSCWGHGIGIADDYSKEFDGAAKILNIKENDYSPVDFDQHASWTIPLISGFLNYPD